ncbi:class I SAM-dependent methyltransferase [Sphingomonas arantia]|uniref:Class I SAM-dependent methyltransferase n=1 Tax=Sphingomonas arantia TaxID=1460676 RepID=A0ABW4U1M6_9SPHN
MIIEDQRELRPFGLWPDVPSAITGLGGTGGATDATYVFHSEYVTTRAGQVTFSGRFQDLRATKGKLRIRVRAMPYGSEASTTAKTTVLRLTDVAAQDGRWSVTLNARPGYYHAIMGRLVEDTDAAASSLSLDMDGWGDGSAHKAKMLDAKKTVFARGSAVGRGWWGKPSPVDEAGLISGEPATIADPASQMCTANQMEEPAYRAWLDRLGMGIHWHRKQWENIYILAVLEAQGMLRPGSRGLGFGCGAECLPSYFASRGCQILATDMPVGHQQLAGWLNTGQHSTAIEQLHWPSLCDAETHARNVSFRPVDMNAMPDDLRGFDFCWSACAFEHLGSIEAGLRFIHQAVDRLRPGGVAVHTTELNLSSDTATVDNESTVLFRRRDMERLALELTAAGHHVLPLKYDAGDRPLDLHIDVPPFAQTNHLKIALRQFVTTSFGIAVIRGPEVR